VAGIEPVELRVKSDLRNHQAIVTVQPPSNRRDGFSLVCTLGTHGPIFRSGPDSDNKRDLTVTVT
jgi:hypothetical protein